MSTQMELPMRDLHVEKVKAAAVEKAVLDKIESRKHWRMVGAAFALVVGTPSALFASEMIYDNQVNQPVFSVDNSLAIRKDGTATIGGATCMTEYNFKQSSQTQSCFFGRRGGWTVSKNFSAMDSFEQVRYGNVQTRACDLAAGRQGYRDVCPS